MKKLLILGLILMLTTPAFARYYDEEPCDTPFGQILNECISHPVSDKESAEVGVGVDVILYEGNFLVNTVTVEYKYDWANVDHQTYVVGTVRLKDLVELVK